MSISIFTNVIGDRVVRNINRVAADMDRVTERLSTGFKVRSDDIAGWFVADQIESQLRGLQAVDASIQSAIAALDLADEALATINDDLLPQLVSLAVDANDGLTTAAEHAALDAQYQAVIGSINDLIDDTKLGSQGLLDGSIAATSEIPTNASGGTITVDFTVNYRTDAASGPLAVLDGTSVDDQTNAAAAVTALTGASPAAVVDFTAARILLSAPSSALEIVAGHTATMSIAYDDGRRLIVGADFAADTARLIRDQLLLDSGASALKASSFSASTIVSVLSSAVGRSN